MYSAVFAHTLCATAFANRWLDVNTNTLSCAWCFSINAFSISSFLDGQFGSNVTESISVSGSYTIHGSPMSLPQTQ